MLTHKVIGPDAKGKFSVGYPTPGTSALTVVCDGCSEQAAREEVSRRNREQFDSERSIKSDRQACGLRGVYPHLEKGR